MKKKLPIYDIVLDELNLKQGVGFISLVDEPAIQVDWIKMAADNQINFKADKDKQLLFGPFLIPDMLIYRYDDKMGEYYVRFRKEEIQKIADKFNEDLNSQNINFQHSDVKVEAFVAQNWVIEGNDKSRNLGFDLPDGTWFGGVKIKDETFWKDKIKSEEVKGFSVEILADLQLELNKNKEKQMEKEIEKVVELAIGDPAVPATDAPAADAPVDESKPLTAEEVSQMIDARFADLMEEVTALKEAIAPLLEEVEPAADAPAEEAMAKIVERITTIEEKLSSTPGAVSVKKKDTALDVEGNKFNKDIERIRAFARQK